MPKRRMFTLDIVDSDAFLDMSQTAQCLYFHLAMRADDDGFVNNAKKIMRMVGSQEDDFRVLMAKRFIIPFDSGVCVIKHWKMHNYIQRDRYKETRYIEEKAMLSVKENDVYTMDTECIQNGNTGKVRLGKDRLGKDSIERGGKSRRFAPPSLQELEEYISEKRYQVDADNFMDFYTSKGWMVGKNKMKDWKAAVRTWARRDRDKASYDEDEKIQRILNS